MKKFEGVANTLFVPLVARIAISKEFPEYFFDLKALELEPDLPQGADKGASQYTNMASVSRYYNMDKKGEMIFDATSESGLKFTNWFIKRTGNKNALMYFGINDSKTFAEKCGMELLEVKTFYPDALSMLGKRLNLVTRVSMMVAEKKKQVLILYLKLN